MRIALCWLMWMLVAPIRLYVRHMPIARGKWRLSRAILEPVLGCFPEDMALIAQVPGGRIPLYFSEDLGKRVLVAGAFEAAEIHMIISYAQPGTAAVDVGANVGLFTVPLAHAVGRDGVVLAFEPHPGTADRLRRNCADNGMANVVVHQLALSDRDGQTSFKLGKDPAYGSTVRVRAGKESGETIAVSCRTLDSVWREAGSPQVSVVKIDVEGAELTVLDGARDLLARCSPVLLVEAESPSALVRLQEWLSALNYSPEPCPGFEPWNHLFLDRGVA